MWVWNFMLIYLVIVAIDLNPLSSNWIIQLFSVHWTDVILFTRLQNGAFLVIYRTKHKPWIALTLISARTWVVISPWKISRWCNVMKRYKNERHAHPCFFFYSLQALSEQNSCLNYLNKRNLAWIPIGEKNFYLSHFCLVLPKEYKKCFWHDKFGWISSNEAWG